MKDDSAIDVRLTGSFATRFWLELFGNSAQFPIANVVLELLLARSGSYMREPDFYLLALGSVVQAAWLTSRQGDGPVGRFIGNLLGPALYTAAEAFLEGGAFFTAPNHAAYWAFSAAIGTLQAARHGAGPVRSGILLVLENIVRSSILFFMYALFETSADPAGGSVGEFFADGSHLFIALAVLLLGVSSGLASLTAERYLALLRDTSTRLRTYSEWLLGPELLRRAFANPGALALKRLDRAVLFMDIRGFTRWSEAQPPESVVHLLDAYYATAEAALARHGAIKHKFAADEVMAVFASARDALDAARDCQHAVTPLLAADGLGAGLGVHYGPVVEGLLGTDLVKFYDVIGDTVNTAKRIEGAAAAGEVLLSQPALDAAGDASLRTASREVMAKGKEGSLTVHCVATGAS